MKNIKLICSILFLIVVALSCTKIEGIDKDLSFLNSFSVPSNIDKIFEISNDNSGNVKITPLGSGASSFIVYFGHGTGLNAKAVVVSGSSVTHSYPEGTYAVSIVAKTFNGDSTVVPYPLTVTYRAPENLVVTLTQAVHNVKVKATADYAASFLVYFGDATNEVGTPLAKGAEISHDYAVAGNYDLKVVALSGGVAKSEKITAVTATDPFGLPIDFESTFIAYNFGTFGTGQTFSKVANPNASGLNTSATVGKFLKGNESWSGTFSPLDIPIDFAAGKKIKVLVYNPDPLFIGKKLNVELESAVGGVPKNGVAVKKVAVTTSGAWEELVFDFSTVSAITPTTKFKQLVFRYNDSGATPGAIIYIDDIRFTN